MPVHTHTVAPTGDDLGLPEEPERLEIAVHHDRNGEIYAITRPVTDPADAEVVRVEDYDTLLSLARKLKERLAEQYSAHAKTLLDWKEQMDKQHERERELERRLAKAERREGKEKP